MAGEVELGWERSWMVTFFSVVGVICVCVLMVKTLDFSRSWTSNTQQFHKSITFTTPKCEIEHPAPTKLLVEQCRLTSHPLQLNLLFRFFFLKKASAIYRYSQMRFWADLQRKEKGAESSKAGVSFHRQRGTHDCNGDSWLLISDKCQSILSAVWC